MDIQPDWVFQCTYLLNESIIHKQASLHQIQHPHPSLLWDFAECKISKFASTVFKCVSISPLVDFTARCSLGRPREQGKISC